MKLFAIYIGGDIPGANIELHDMRFVVAQTIEETHDELRRQWWGTPDSLHIDCWAEINHADGFDVVLKTEPFDGLEKLFFVNLGGYDRSEFTEQHKTMFVVAQSEAEAKARASKTVRHWDLPHRDEIYAAEHAFCLSATGNSEGLQIHLFASTLVKVQAFSCDYIPLGTTR